MRRIETGAVAALAIALAGCAAAATSATAQPPAASPGATAGGEPPHGDEVPAWARHVNAAAVDPRQPVDATISRLMTELREPGLKDGHLPAGQLAIAAIASLDAGHRADAALLLSIACYRYEQQYHHITEVGYDGQSRAPYRVSDSAYFRLLNRELGIYQRLTFDRYLDVLAATLLGEPAVAADVHRRLEDIFYLSQSPDDENDDDEGGPPPRQGGRRDEALTNPALAAAFLERLRADATDKRKELYVLMDLARTPLATFQLEALRLAKRPFMIRICSMIARQLGSEQQTLLGLVSDPNSATRANAALVLGILPLTDAQRAQLEKRLAVETERSVRLSIAHALARHGRRERLADIAAGLNPCVGDPCMDALALLASLPRDLRADLDPEVFVAIAGNERQAPHARTLAVEILRHRAITGPLAGRAREALLAASTARDRELSFVATAAIAADASFAREDVLSRLNGPAPAYRALLARLVRVVTPADLALLTSLMPLFADKSPDEAQFVVRAAARIPGKDAEESLLVWFDAYERVRSPIILALTGRRETSPATLQHLAEADEPSKLLVEVATGAPDAIATLERHLRVGAQDRMSAAMVARAVRDPRTREALLQLVTYEDAQYYPSDVLVRHAAISALLAIALR